MQIRVGYELVYDCPQPTPMILTLHVHSTRVSDIVVPDHLITRPSIPITAYRDGFGNWCSRIVGHPRADATRRIGCGCDDRVQRRPGRLEIVAHAGVGLGEKLPKRGRVAVSKRTCRGGGSGVLGDDVARPPSQHGIVERLDCRELGVA
jgi:hypothetical protein